MAKYHLTKKAVQDLDAIWAYTLKTWSEKQADEYYSSLVLALIVDVFRAKDIEK